MSKMGDKIKAVVSSIKTKMKNFFVNVKTQIKKWSDNIKSKFANTSSKYDIVSNNNIQTQRDNSKVQTKNNVLKPQEDMYVYKTVENSINNSIDVDEQEQNQSIEKNEDNKVKSFQKEKVQNIKINEETGSVEYTTVDGNNYTVDINKILDKKKGIYKDFSISKKCKDLTSSFIKGRRLEKSLNPLVINGLNKDEDIDKYIKCVNNEEKLFFDLEHNTQNSKIGFFDRNKMKKIAKIEQRLGANVQIEPGFFSKIKTQFTELLKNENTNKKENEEKMIAKQYKAAFKMLKNKDINSLYESEEYAKIEANLEKCANWYMNNGNLRKADKCINLLSDMIKDKHKSYYLPKYNEEVKKGNQEYAIERYAQEDSINRYNIEKLRIKRNWLIGEHDKARELYSKLINDLGIALTQEEYEKSIQHDGLITGTYSKLIEEKIQSPDGTYTTNSYFKDMPIIGNERALAVLEQIRIKKQNPVVMKTIEQDKQKVAENNAQEGEQKNVIPVINNIEDNEKKTSNEQQNIEQQEKEENGERKQFTKEEINKLIDKYSKLNDNRKYKKGLAITYIMALADYLEENDDKEVQNELDKEMNKLESVKDNINNLYNDEKVGFERLNNLQKVYKLFKNGKKSIDGERTIISPDKNAWKYYLYLTNYNIKQMKDFIEYNKSNTIKNLGWEEEQKKLKRLMNVYTVHNKEIEEIRKTYEANKEEIDYGYFEYLKQKYDLCNIATTDNLIAEAKFMEELRKIQYFEENSEYLKLAIIKEKLSRVNNKTNQANLCKMEDELEIKIKNGEKIGNRTLELLADIYYTGLRRNGFDELFVEPNKILAEKLYSRLLEENKNIENSDVYNRLFTLYNDNTLPIYNPSKARKIENVMRQKRIPVQQQDVKKNKVETNAYTYVCSDIHGEYGIYQAVINQLKDNDKLYILGDVIDRGPDGIKILKDIMDRQKKGQVEFLIGNHEYIMIQALYFNNQADKKTWIANGGEITLNNYNTLSQEKQQEIQEFLMNALVYKEINMKGKNIYLVHAKNIEDDKTKSKKVIEMIENGEENELFKAVWDRTRENNQEEISKKDRLTIVGHTPPYNEFNLRYSEQGIIYIDGGATYRGTENLIRLEDGKVMYFDTETEREKLIDKETEQR